MTTADHATTAPDATETLQRTAAGIAGLIALLYGLIWAGVLPAVAGAESGEVAILGVAGVVFLVLAVLLWRFAGRLLWLGTAILQVTMIGMYVVISAEREPAFEVWGLSIRVAQVALIGVLVALVVRATRQRRNGP